MSPQATAGDEVASDERTQVESGKYRVLHKYLQHRYADVVVLTFGQIEDLLGFSLPQMARTYEPWWTLGANVEGAPHADAWLLAGRMAAPNLHSRIVTFERTPTLRRRQLS